jgi:hypothetical protein
MSGQDSATPAIGCLMVVAVLFALAFGLIGGRAWAQRDMNDDLVRRGIKEYNQQTGVLEWKAEWRDGE